MAEQMTYQQALAVLAGLSEEQRKSTMKAWEQWGNNDQKEAVKNWRKGKRPAGDGGNSGGPNIGRITLETWKRQLSEWHRLQWNAPLDLAAVFRDADPIGLPGRAFRELSDQHRSAISRGSSGGNFDQYALERALSQALVQLGHQIEVLKLRLACDTRRQELADLIERRSYLLSQEHRTDLRIDLSTASESDTLRLRDALDALEAADKHARDREIQAQLRHLPRHTGGKRARRR
jgi:hypothetical protein